MPHVNELHEQHDQLLVVSFASGDLAPDDRDRATAQSLVASCTQCAELHDDIVAIARATRALPPAVRTRDFRLTNEQAAKLRPAGWRRFVAGLSAPGSVFSRQLGLGMATLGIAGLLLSAAPTIQLGMGGSAAAPPVVPSAAPAAGAEQAPEYPSGGAVKLEGQSGASAAASAAPAAAASAPAASQAPGLVYAGGDTSAADSPSPKNDAFASDSRNSVSLDHGSKGTIIPAPAPQGAGGGGTSGSGAEAGVPPAESTSTSGGPSGLAVVSVLLLGAGVLVLLLRSISRRIAAG